MSPSNIFGMSETSYGLLIIALTVGVLFGAVFLVLLLYRLRDSAWDTMTDKRKSWVIRLLVSPVWFLLFCVCLVFTICSVVLVFSAISDLMDRWRRDMR